MNSMMIGRMLVVVSLIGSFFSLSLIFPDLYEAWIDPPLSTLIPKPPVLLNFDPRPNGGKEPPPTPNTAPSGDNSAEDTEEYFTSHLIDKVKNVVSKIQSNDVASSVVVLNDIHADLKTTGHFITDMEKNLDGLEKRESGLLETIRMLSKTQQNYVDKINEVSKAQKYYIDTIIKIGGFMGMIVASICGALGVFLNSRSLAFQAEKHRFDIEKHQFDVEKHEFEIANRSDRTVAS